MLRDIGAVYLDRDRCRFRVWAPRTPEVTLHVVAPEERRIPMTAQKNGYHQAIVTALPDHARYYYQLADGLEFPDPASAFQPEGVHGPSQVVRTDYAWTDQQWHGIPLEKYIIYEVHTGAFSPEGTFEAIIPHLDTLIDLGITALELMPVAQFPGQRNWGYDGVYMYAPQNSYGGPGGLRRLVDACHRRGMAVILDVVYNHLGPEGNYLPQFGPYFTDSYKTPWGAALNYDDAHSDEVRRYFIQNALYWVTEYHIDAVRLDAVHAILDHSAQNILKELAESLHDRGTAMNRRVYAIAESALNDTRLIRSTELGGDGLDAQWNDDFHHALHSILTRETEGYYVDFGDFQQMSQAFSEGFVYSGQYSENRKRRHGNSSRAIAPVKFVVYAQNHDQIGNRMLGERLSQLIPFEFSKLAASTVLFSPFIPLLFMGDEYGEPAPFQYFVSHTDSDLIDAVRKGRREEFAAFKWEGALPDPQDPSAFLISKLNHGLRYEKPHRTIFAMHKELIRLRTAIPALAALSKEEMDVRTFEDQELLVVHRRHVDSEIVTLFNFNSNPVELKGKIPAGRWRRRFDSSDRHWLGPGTGIPELFQASPRSILKLNPAGAVLLEREIEE